MNISTPETIIHLTRKELDTIIGSRIRREDLVEIHISGSVKTIGDNAFKVCQNLQARDARGRRYAKRPRKTLVIPNWMMLLSQMAK